jgi:hypothetical protein
MTRKKDMTEGDWLKSEEPQRLLQFLGREVILLADQGPPERGPAMRRHLLRLTSRRKAGLFACACSRRLWPVFQDERSRKAIQTTELFLDGYAEESQRWAAATEAEAARDAIKTLPGEPGRTQAQIARAAAIAAMKTAWLHVEDAATESAEAATWAGLFPTLGDAHKDQAALLRDIWGNPFRPVEVEASWRTPPVVALATTIYEERCFEDMPVLADALDEVGADAELLQHLRQKEAGHCRGCWCLDLVLGHS